jgi:outer membrane receptor protein involved in Fe transport
MLGGHVSLTHQLSEGRQLYATLARGYKAGGFNIGAAVPAGSEQFDAEYLWNLETGAKVRSEDGRLQGQLSLFYMRRTDQQVETSFQLDPTDPLTFVIYTDNAARGENYGVEGSLWWHATDRLQLGGSLGVLDTRYINYQRPDRNLDGREQAHAPEYQLALAAQYRHPLGWLARVDTQSVDNFYYGAGHDERSNPFTLVNLKLGYETQRWAAYAWVRNLFDEDYAMRGFFFANEPPDFIEKRYVQAGDPRHAGVTLTYSFR